MITLGRIQIEKVSNGFIVDTPSDQGELQGRNVFETIDQVFTHLLELFEDRGPFYHYDHYGKVEISRIEPEAT